VIVVECCGKGYESAQGCSIAAVMVKGGSSGDAT
jgi:hypothetical protein